MSRVQLPAIAMAMLALAAISAQAEGVYKWVDDQGHVHFSDAAPDRTKIQKLDLPAAAAPVPANQERSWQEQSRLASERRTYAAQQEQAAAKQQREANNACLRARQNLDVLNRTRPVYSISTQGERQYLDDNERQARIAAANQQVATSCRN
jgi:hypothetical protein